MCCSNTRTLMCNVTLNYILLYLPANTFKVKHRRVAMKSARRERKKQKTPAMLLVCFSLERERKGGTEKKLESGMKNFIQRTGGSFTNSMMLNVIYRPGWKMFWRCRCSVGGFCAIDISSWVNPNAREKGENPSRNYSLA